MGVVGSMRMNDAHTDSEDRMWFGRSARKIERPDLLIGSDLPEAVHGIPWTFSWLWDYARDEVRERFLGIMDEALTRYDFDGLELDFSRAPPFFKGGEAVQNIPTMTGFVRQARAIVRRHSQERGRERRLIVRVPTSIGESLLIGLDTLAWIREGLADIVVLSSPGYCITRADVAEAAGAAGDGPVLIYRGFDGATYGASPQEGYERNPPAVLRGAALNGYREGAQGIAVFNYDYGSHRAGPVPGDYHDMTEDHLGVLTELRDPDSLARRDRCYYLAGPPDQGAAADHRPLLPRQLALRGRGAGAGHALSITVRDDLRQGAGRRPHPGRRAAPAARRPRGVEGAHAPGGQRPPDSVRARSHAHQLPRRRVAGVRRSGAAGGQQLGAADPGRGLDTQAVALPAGL